MFSPMLQRSLRFDNGHVDEETGVESVEEQETDAQPDAEKVEAVPVSKNKTAKTNFMQGKF